MGLKIIFMGTPDFAVPALEALIESSHLVIAVYTQPPRPAGRGMAIRKSPVHQVAEKNGIPVFTPENFKNPEEISAFKNLAADVAVVAAYGLILPRAILETPKNGCINIHASLLPRWRGAAPIQYAILEGDYESGISIMQMEEGLDTGPVLAATGFKLSAGETAATLHDKLSALGGKMISGVVDDLEKGSLNPRTQDEAGVTYAPKIKKEQARIDWSKGAVEIDRLVRAFNPFPGAFFEFGGGRYKVLGGRVEQGKGTPGETLDDNLLVGAGQAAYRILRLQKEGKQVLDANAFLQGENIPKGTFLK